MELFTAPHLIFLFILMFVVGGPVIIIPYWQILKKAGFPPILSILVMVPLVNLALLYFVAFSDWKRPGDPSPI